ncbi:hypothetical protein E2C01_034532 [Portunus trituberculatus]|uniref:Uncharacterized protein n=1 Tax=Portunus trituberculatus TaxID=210409 RepID=A0A5B7F5W5_PORTR|nr:hypothetical protein [Portunus trituberculatus]
MGGRRRHPRLEWGVGGAMLRRASLTHHYASSPHLNSLCAPARLTRGGDECLPDQVSVRLIQIRLPHVQ